MTDFNWQDYIYLNPDEFTEQGYEHYVDIFDTLSSTEDGRNLIISAYETGNSINAFSERIPDEAGDRLHINSRPSGNADAFAGSRQITVPENGVSTGFYFDQNEDLHRFSMFRIVTHEFFHLAHPAASEELTVDFVDRFLASNYDYGDPDFRIRGDYSNGARPDSGPAHPSIEPEPVPELQTLPVSEIGLPPEALEYESTFEDTATFRGAEYTPPITPGGLSI